MVTASVVNITLELTRDEADVILSLVSRCIPNGDPGAKAAEDIYKALLGSAEPAYEVQAAPSQYVSGRVNLHLTKRK